MLNRVIHVFSERASFRTQLLAIFSAAILTLAAITSITTTWLTNRQAQALMIAQGEQITGNLARQSVLAFLYGSGDNARDSATATLAFPDVIHVRLIDREGKALLSMDGKSGFHFPADVHPPKELNEARLLREGSHDWLFVAPVLSHDGPPDDPIYTANPAPSELLGYVFVVVSQETLHKMESGILLNNILTAFLVALALVFVLNLVARRMTRPLDKLAETMMRAEEDKAHVYAELAGPKEIMRMASVFNKMMASLEEQDLRLREHNETLESQVALRTQELVQARDTALAASRHKSEFLANMSHELRTPIQAIIGYAELLKEEMEIEGRDEATSDLKSIMTNARNLLAMINNILDMAKIEAGRMELRTEHVNLAETIAQAADTIRPLMRQNGNELVVTQEGTDLEVEIDSGKLVQVLLNLLSNAAKFTQEGRVQLNATHHGGWLTASIADNGIGIGADKQELIFEEFRQVDMSTTRKFEGTGLGLAITRRLCHLMNGEISLASTLGEGSTFTVKIPLTRER